MLIPMEQIRAPEGNPRSAMDAAELEELTASIRMHGVLQPIVLRAIDEGAKKPYRIVCGARRFAAPAKAGLEEIPAEVRVMTDAEELELQLIENMQRADVHPLDEAIAFQRLQRDHSYSLEDLTLRSGKERSYVVRTLQLTRLAEKLHKPFRAGEIGLSAAFALARLPNAKDQLKVYEEVARERWGEGKNDPLSPRQVLRASERVLADLGRAPFDPKDADLVPAAGACTGCPKRSGNAPDLFGDVKSKNSCSDPACFRSKADAAWDLRAAEAKARGQRVLSDNEFKKVRLDLVDLSRDMEDPRTGRWVSAAKVVKSSGIELVPMLHRDPETLVVRELIPEKELARALPKKSRVKDPGHAKYEREQRRNRAKLKAVNEAFVRKAFDALRVQFSIPQITMLTGEPSWGVLEAFVYERALGDKLLAMAKSLGVQRQKVRGKYGMQLESTGDALRRHFAAMPAEDRAAARFDLVLLVMLDHGTPFEATRPEPYGPLLEAFKLLGLDSKKIAAAAMKAAGESPRASEKKPGKRAAKATGGKKRKASRQVPTEDLEDEGDE